MQHLKYGFKMFNVYACMCEKGYREIDHYGLVDNFNNKLPQIARTTFPVWNIIRILFKKTLFGDI